MALVAQAVINNYKKKKLYKNNYFFLNIQTVSKFF